MTGLVERSSSKYVNFQTTHLAFVRRSQHNDHHLAVGQQDSNKSKHINTILNNLDINRRILPSSTHHSLDNQFKSASKLKRTLSNRRCDSTSSDSSTSTLVEDGVRNDEISDYTDINHGIGGKQNDPDLILVLPSVSNSSASFAEEKQKQNIASLNKVSTTSRKNCCSVPCIDSMSTVSSVCPPCSTPITTNCFKKSPLLQCKNETTSLSRHGVERKVESMQKGKTPSSIHLLAKTNFTHFIKKRTCSGSASPYKDFSENNKINCKKDSNTVQVPLNPRVQELLKSPFKEWLL